MNTLVNLDMDLRLVHRILLAVTFTLLVGCGAGPVAPYHPGPQRLQPSPATVVKIPTSDGLDATSPPSAPRPAVPAFLTDDPAGFPLRVKRIRNGSVYAERNGAAINTADQRLLLMTHTVIDPDQEGQPPRPRLLCDDASTRMALYVDVDSLAIVALDDAFVSAAPDRKTPIEKTSPGVRLAPGARLERLGHPPSGDNRVERIRFKGFLLTVEGYVETSRIGFAYRPQTETPDIQYDAELPRGTTFVDSPQGTAFAWLEPYPNTTQKHVGKKLGPAQRGYVLLAFDDTDAKVVGWVKRQDVVQVPLTEGGWGGLGMGSGRGRLKAPVRLREGSVLLSEVHQEVIGIVTQDDDFECVAQCNTSDPKVEVQSCLGSVRVQAAASSIK